MFSIPKSNNDPYGLEFDRCLALARYVYPAPDNPYAQEIVSHAKQIYESELIERSLCAMSEDFVPCTYKTISENFGTSSPLLERQNHYRLIKEKSAVRHERVIFEYKYEFLDILHLPTKSIIECKVASGEASLERHRKKILEKWRTRRGIDYNDYYLIAYNKKNEFEVLDFLKIVSVAPRLTDPNAHVLPGRFTRIDFEKFVTTRNRKY